MWFKPIYIRHENGTSVTTLYRCMQGNKSDVPIEQRSSEYWVSELRLLGIDIKTLNLHL